MKRNSMEIPRNITVCDLVSSALLQLRRKKNDVILCADQQCEYGKQYENPCSVFFHSRNGVFIFFDSVALLSK